MTKTNITLNSMTVSQAGQPAQAKPWGWHLVLNLYECSAQLIESEEVIAKFVVDLCDKIEMRRFGDPVIINFGDDPAVTGYSLFQLIETSNIAGHFANQSQAAYLDVFSCKEFDPQITAEFCSAAFEAKTAIGVFIYRD